METKYLFNYSLQIPWSVINIASKDLSTWYYFILCTHKKHIFSFLINVYWGVDSNSEIHSSWPTQKKKNDNPKKKNELSKFSGVVSDYVNGLQHLFRHVKKPFINTSSIRKNNR